MSASSKGLNVKTRRVISYVVLVIITIMCLFWFYVLFVNSTRSHADLTKGFSALPSTSALKNVNSLLHSSNIPILSGLLNSVIVAAFTALLSTYFSTMTAYAIHAYEFKLKKFMFTFILGIMMIPTQVTALGFVKLVGTLHMEDTLHLQVHV